MPLIYRRCRVYVHMRVLRYRTASPQKSAKLWYTGAGVKADVIERTNTYFF